MKNIHFLTNLIKKQKIPNKILIHSSFRKFSSKDELDNIKSELKQERQGIFNKVSSFFNRNSNKITEAKSSLNTEDIEKLLNKKTENDKKDNQTINKIINIQSQNLSKTTINEDCIPQLIDLFKSLNNIENFINDKRFIYFIDDLLFAINACTNPKALIGILNFSALFLKGKQFEEFAEKVTKRIMANLGSTEVEDMMFYLTFLKRFKSEEAYDLISERFKHEIMRRLDKYYYKNLRNDLSIENDDFVKILYVYDQYGLADKELYATIFDYIVENLSTFSIKELVEICLFFVDKKSSQFETFFEQVRSKIEKNIKNTSNDLLYDIVYMFSKMGLLTNDIVKAVMENLLQNSTVNKELPMYKIFEKSENKLICKLTYQVGEFANNVSLTKENQETRLELLNLVNDYFMLNLASFDNNLIILMLDVLSKNKILDEDILKEMLGNINSRLTNETAIALSNFYLNKNIDFDKRILKNLETLFLESNDFKTRIDIMMIFLRKRLTEKITKENIDLILSAYKGIEHLKAKAVKENIITLWCLSHFNSFAGIEPVLKDLFEILSNQDVDNRVSNFEFMLLIQACFKINFSNEFLGKFEGKVLERLNDFELLDFIAVFSTYAKDGIGSEEFLENFCDVINMHLGEFTLLQLEVLVEGLLNYKALSLKQVELIDIINALIVNMKVKSLEQSVDQVDEELIRESIREYINKTIKYKKLI
jgi:hypothetical protein